MYTHSRTFLFLVALWLITACNKENDPTPISYSWKPSQLSQGFLVVGHLEMFNNELYALGHDFQANRICKYDNASQKWAVVAQVPRAYDYYYGFAVYANEVYIYRFNELLKLKDGQTERVLAGNWIQDVAEFNGELLIIGQGLDVSGEKYSVVSYDGTQFSPLYDGFLHGHIVKANDKVYLPGNPACKYDGNTVEKIDYTSDFRSVDDEENIYSTKSDAVQTQVIKNLKSGEKISVGKPIPITSIVLRHFQLYDNTLFALGMNYTLNVGAAYFLWRNSWMEIPTVVELYFITPFDSKLLAVTEGGKIIELAKN